MIDGRARVARVIAGWMSLASPIEAFTAVCISINIRHRPTVTEDGRSLAMQLYGHPHVAACTPSRPAAGHHLQLVASRL